MQDYLAKNRTLIHKELKIHLSAKEKEYRKVNAWSGDLLPRIYEFVSGGKCLRGSLFVFAYESGGKKANKEIRKIAAGLELIHAALIIHDDIMDDDSYRHGKSSIHKQYADLFSSEDMGKGVGICAGDVAYFSGMELIANGLKKIDANVAGEAIAFLGDELNKVALAQIQDLYFSGAKERISLKDVLNLYLYKTGRYTFSMPFVLGSMLSTKKNLVNYEKLGEHLGVIFQIKDDQLDLFAMKREIGKPIGSDIRSNKKTLFNLELFASVNKDEKIKLNKIFGNSKIKNKDMLFVQEVMKKRGVVEKVMRFVVQEKKKSEKIINELKIPYIFKNKLLELLEMSINRKK
jgi:geranylgeranyl diphosphate synthase type I